MYKYAIHVSKCLRTYVSSHAVIHVHMYVQHIYVYNNTCIFVHLYVCTHTREGSPQYCLCPAKAFKGLWDRGTVQVAGESGEIGEGPK